MEDSTTLEKRNKKKDKRKGKKRFPYKRFGKYRCLDVKEYRD